MAGGSFFDRVADLRGLVGSGKLEGKVEVDQIYARHQHEGLDFNHPRGGQAKFLEQPLLSGAAGFMQGIADSTLEEGPAEGMRGAVEDLSDEVYKHAPVEFDHLRRSGHPIVTDAGAVVYDRPPEVHRLSEAELKALSRGRRRG